MIRARQRPRRRMPIRRRVPQLNWALPRAIAGLAITLGVLLVVLSITGVGAGALWIGLIFLIPGGSVFLLAQTERSQQRADSFRRRPPS